MQQLSTIELLQDLLSRWPRRWVSEVLFEFSAPEAALIAGEVREQLLCRYPHQQRHSPHPPLQAACFSFFDHRYPEPLRHIPDPPLVLYFEGNVELLQQRCIAMVGARRATQRGRDFAERLAADLCRAGLVVISGLAHGIDGAAHRGALSAGGDTVGVLGNGLNGIYPQRHTGLARQMLATGGLLLSEYPPAMPPLAHQFPERNRIISGLSLGVVVVEAGLRSGSLITARLALEQGRDVFAVPGAVNSLVSQGCHRLIRQGAELVSGVDEVLASLGIEQPAQSTPAPPSVTRDQGYLLSFMQGYSVTLDELLALTAWPVARLTAALAQMELIGIVRVDADGYIATSKIDS